MVNKSKSISLTKDPKFANALARVNAYCASEIEKADKSRKDK